MKKTLMLLFIATSLWASVSKAQDSQPTFGIRLGGHLTDITGKKPKGNSLPQDIKVSGEIGVNIEKPITPTFSFQP